MAATGGDFEPEIVVEHELYDDADESEPVSWDDEPEADSDPVAITG